MSARGVLYPEFLSFMVECGALLFGDFTLKSGRKSPYFINTGEYKTGAQLSKLGKFYVKLIHNSVRSIKNAGRINEALVGDELTAINSLISTKFNVLFGPAYKGIPLVTAVATELSSTGLNMNVSFNRKEPKDHGEGERIMGYIPQSKDRIAIIEDVTTAGTSVRETIALLEDHGIDAKIVALYISVNRMERGSSHLSAIAELKQECDIEVYEIATIENIIDYLENTPDGCISIPGSDMHASNIRKYLSEYGAMM